MSLSLNSGFPFANVDKKTVYITDNDDDDKDNMLGTFIDIGKNRKFQLAIPNDSFRLSIFGPSGVGKSTFVSSVIKEYKKKYKKNKIYMISPTKDDDAYADLKDVIQYIKIDDSLITDPMEFTEFSNALIIFDDSEMLSAKKI